MRELEGVHEDVGKAYDRLDPVREPAWIFDPSEPDTAGRLVALALLSQPRALLDRIQKMYGSGVYAIYYTGDHPAYTPISGTETPIYVGKADPASPQARTARQQGERLYGRLMDHRKQIRTVEAHAREENLDDPLRIADFECRRLVTASHAQLVAERHLIHVFQPLWNKEMNVCWGISKHGDAADKRGNSRSPWDTLHLGRQWAMDPILENARTPQRILGDIKEHIVANPPFTDREKIIEYFLREFEQDPMIATAPVEDEGSIEDVPEGAAEEQ